ncbi:MAG: hypothetical protein ISQ65_06370 [Pseudomonadales bacterium]|nr:hypothetical protein [Pseudomonadales bacterium]
MSDLNENNRRLAKFDLQHPLYRFIALVMLSWFLAATPSIKVLAENTPAIDGFVSGEAAEDMLRANYAATRLAAIDSLDELLPENLFTVEVVIFKRLDTQTALIASADRAAQDKSTSPEQNSLDTREPLLRSVDAGLSRDLLQLSPDTPQVTNRPGMHAALPILPASAPECVADPTAIYAKPLSIQGLLEKLTIRLQPEDFGGSYSAEDQTSLPRVETLMASLTAPELSPQTPPIVAPELPPKNRTTITPTPYLTLIEGLTRFDALREHQQFRQTTSQDLRLSDSVKRLKRDGNYEILGHLAWQQRVPQRGEPQHIYINLNEGQLQGELAVTLGRYLHTSARLWLRPDANASEPGQYAQLAQSRRMRSATLHYFDHPLFGMLVRIDKVEHPNTLRDTFSTFKDALEAEG